MEGVKKKLITHKIPKLNYVMRTYSTHLLKKHYTRNPVFFSCRFYVDLSICVEKIALKNSKKIHFQVNLLKFIWFLRDEKIND